MNPFRVVLEVTATSESQLESYCAKFLKERGWNVTAPHAKWEKMGDFLHRVGLHPEGLRRKLRQANCPHVLFQHSKSRNGSSGRRLAILSNPDFDAFCVQNK